MNTATILWVLAFVCVCAAVLILNKRQNSTSDEGAATAEEDYTPNHTFSFAQFLRATFAVIISLIIDVAFLCMLPFTLGFVGHYSPAVDNIFVAITSHAVPAFIYMAITSFLSTLLSGRIFSAIIRKCDEHYRNKSFTAALIFLVSANWALCGAVGFIPMLIVGAITHFTLKIYRNRF